MELEVLTGINGCILYWIRTDDLKKKERKTENLIARRKKNDCQKAS